MSCTYITPALLYKRNYIHIYLSTYTYIKYTRRAASENNVLDIKWEMEKIHAFTLCISCTIPYVYVKLTPGCGFLWLTQKSRSMHVAEWHKSNWVYIQSTHTYKNKERESSGKVEEKKRKNIKSIIAA